ncbi:5-oxoprolinase subunit B family protein [Nioella aestuarii]|uniref:5-oxoprolinase subunit B family protein n=1 Tax=Nioella aestuarii TaxID=1662864 RepID=UPI003D7F3A1B
MITAEQQGGFPRLHRMGEAGMLVEFGDRLSMSVNAATLAFRAAVDEAAWGGVEESATSLKSVFLRFDPVRLSHEALEAALLTLLNARDWYAETLPHGRKLWRVPTVFGGEHGPQLEEAADLAGLSPEAAVTQISETPVRVLTIGFSPGMPYLGQLPDAFDIPRKTELNPHVPAGGLALAIRQLVLFPVGTQTGWRWIGRAAIDVFGQQAEHPFPLTAGDEILFHPVSAAAFEDAWAEVDAGRMVASCEALP